MGLTPDDLERVHGAGDGAGQQGLGRSGLCWRGHREYPINRPTIGAIPNRRA